MTLDISNPKLVIKSKMIERSTCERTVKTHDLFIGSEIENSPTPISFRALEMANVQDLQLVPYKLD